METLSRAFPKLGAWSRGAEAGERLAAAAPELFADLANCPPHGLLKAGRSSWTHRRIGPAGDYAIKTYVYRTAWDRVRAWPRTWSSAAARANREWDALVWMQAHGFAAPNPVAVAEERRHGWLTRATLIVEWWPGESLDLLLPRLPATEQDELVGCLFAWVHRLHASGFRDRNLDLRNLLARREQDHWQLAKIDSGRFCLRRQASTTDRLARADWARLLPQLQQLGVPAARLPTHLSR